MYRNFVIACSIVFVSSITSLSASKVTDPEAIAGEPAQTTNNMGMTFPDLGSFEKGFMGDVRVVDLEHCHKGKVLLLGDGYGRLSMRALRATSCCSIFVNDLSAENLQPLSRKVQAIQAKGQRNLIPGRYNPIEMNLSPRIHIFAGDSLQLPFNREFIRAVGQPTPYNAFQTIANSNMIHFFDGEQTLQFLINTFNLLEPGGSLHLMTHIDTRMRGFTMEELLATNHMPNIYAHVVYTIKNLAQQEGTILFPGYIDDKWLLKTNTLRYLLSLKPNGLLVTNMHNLNSLIKLARTVGFDVSALKFMSVWMEKGRCSAVDVRPSDADYGAMVLRKPATHDGGILSTADLDPEFVNNCLASKERMKQFVETKLEFLEAYPFVRLKDAKQTP